MGEVSQPNGPPGAEQIKLAWAAIGGDGVTRWVYERSAGERDLRGGQPCLFLPVHTRFEATLGMEATLGPRKAIVRGEGGH